MTVEVPTELPREARAGSRMSCHPGGREAGRACCPEGCAGGGFFAGEGGLRFADPCGAAELLRTAACMRNPCLGPRLVLLGPPPVGRAVLACCIVRVQDKDDSLAEVAIRASMFMSIYVHMVVL